MGIMVFRFTAAQDEELMRELIRLRPFAAQRGTTLRVWDQVAEGVSRAVGSSLNAKQVRDRLHILKKQFKSGKLQSKRGSGTEESLDAINVQSHYNDLPGFQLDLKARELEQNQLQFDARLAFDAKQAEERLRFEERVQSSNRELIIECAKIFSGALEKSSN
ncbi:hypothetical protein BBJ28_00026445 [Nothophytophthora sp. Chile5]|nr:hypothetical protein BBJ28_00026445 [Nothophytophthora sp. Chile5]